MTRTRIGRLLFAVALALALTTIALACGGDDDESSDGAATTETSAATTEGETDTETETGDVADLNLVDSSKLTVGMSLQFEPQMYLDDSGEPAGYDVVLVEELAEQMGVELDIQNLDFNGLIPGLVSKRFDMVSVGLSATPERKESVDFSREYVPYVQVLAAAADDSTEATIEAFNTSDKAITSLQGSTAEKLVAATFPEAQSKSFPDQNAAFLEVSTGRADAIVVENYLLAQFNESNDDALEEVALEEPLQVEYGSYAVQKGNTALADYLSDFICEKQESGELADIYEETIGAELPEMPECS